MELYVICEIANDGIKRRMRIACIYHCSTESSEISHEHRKLSILIS